MSTLCPYRIIKGDDGLSVKVEWDVHYLTDEQIGIVRKYIADIEAENAELREELAKWERLTAGINLPDYPVSQFVPKDLERENAKLRELAKEACELARVFFDCGGTFNDLDDLLCEASALGIEVDA